MKRYRMAMSVPPSGLSVTLIFVASSIALLIVVWLLRLALIVRESRFRLERALVVALSKAHPNMDWWAIKKSARAIIRTMQTKTFNENKKAYNLGKAALRPTGSKVVELEFFSDNYDMGTQQLVIQGVGIELRLAAEMYLALPQELQVEMERLAKNGTNIWHALQDSETRQKQKIADAKLEFIFAMPAWQCHMLLEFFLLVKTAVQPAVGDHLLGHH